MTIVARFEAFYRDFDTTDIRDAESVYHVKTVFRDPVKVVSGRQQLMTYLEHSRQGLTHCKFTLAEPVCVANTAFWTWDMHYSHPKLDQGNISTLRGATLIKFEDLVVAQEDFYDLGAMVYEKVPMLGMVVRRIKSGLM